MDRDFRLFPESASTVSDSVDLIYFYLCAVSGFFTVLIAALLLVMSVLYRRRKDVRSATEIHGSLKLELLWTLIPGAIAISMFVWGAKLFVKMQSVPAEGMPIFVTGKQWMWKIQHPTGHREINELHMPVGQTMLLTMTSEDVIHDFFVPAFRVKFDVLPGRYTQAWFEATKPGRYHLFCAEYCGTKHSEMIGEVVVMEPDEYQAWLSGTPAGQTPIESGAALFEKHRCNTCHAAGSGQRGPDLVGKHGSEVRLRDGRVVAFDDNYVRESIVNPGGKVVLGFEPLMPTYTGQLTEEEITHLLAYIRSLGAVQEAPGQADDGR